MNPTDPITATAASSLSKLALDYGLAGILLVILIIAAAWLIKYFSDQVKACHEKTSGVVEKNTEAFQGVQIALVKLEARLDR